MLCHPPNFRNADLIALTRLGDTCRPLDIVPWILTVLVLLYPFFKKSHMDKSLFQVWVKHFNPAGQA